MPSIIFPAKTSHRGQSGSWGRREQNRIHVQRPLVVSSQSRFSGGSLHDHARMLTLSMPVQRGTCVPN